MAHYTESQLITRGGMRTEARIRDLLKSAAAEVTVFVSHSHKDAHLIAGLEALIADAGVKLYIDWQDATMPTEISPETARRLKARIRENNN